MEFKCDLKLRRWFKLNLGTTGYHTDLLYKVRTSRTKLKSKWLIILADFINVIKSFKMTFYSKYSAIELKAKDTESLKTKTQKDKKLVL